MQNLYFSHSLSVHSTELHNGSCAVPPTKITKMSTGKVGCHKTAWTVTGCGATFIWKIDGTNAQIEINFGIAGK